MRKVMLMLLSVLFMSAQLLAQGRTITGKVTDAQGTAVPNASVQVKGTNVGTTTGSDGNFSLSVPATAKILVVSSVGYTNQEVTLGESNNVVISLMATDASLQEVVVVGYTTTTKEAFTGSAKTVSGEELNNKSVSNVSQALAGEVAGVRVINTSGQPGTSATIRIRGIGSVNGNRAPLYVVDGIPYSGNINSINNSDVASVTVLKDAAATAIYGSRGANGVIVISTRNGKGKKSFIEVDGKYGTNMALLPRYDVLTSPEEYIALSWEAMYNWGNILGAEPVSFANQYLFSRYGIDARNNIWNVTNGGQLIDPDTRMVKSGVTRKYDPERWEDYAFQSSIRKEVNLKMGGGDSKTNYYTSFGYLKDEGYVLKSDFTRLSARLNLNHEVNSWLQASMNIGYANTVTNFNGEQTDSGSPFWFADNIPPIYPLFLRDAEGNKVPDPIFGGFRYDYGSTGRKFGSLTNAIADASYNTDRSNRNELTGNTSLTVKFTKELSLENRLGVQYYNSVNANLVNKFYGSAASQNGAIYQSKTELMNLNLLNMLRYAKRFGSHNLEILAAHEATDYKQTISGASGYNLVESNNLELSNAVVKNPTSYSYSNTNALESYFAQLNYDFDRTYYVSATGRRDGSSRFVKNKWGTFGSIGLGWVVSNMSFMDNMDVLNYLKLKTSYGVLGDQQGVGLYPGYDRFDVANLNDEPSITFTSRGNPDLTWETSKMFQVGAEFKLGSFLTGSIDYYVKNTDNLIFERRNGISNGYALIQVNDGQLRNQGVEFDLTAHILKKSDYFLDLGINGEHFTNKITTMPIDPSTPGKQKVIDVQGSYGWSVGHSIYDFYMRNFEGVDPEDGTSTWTVYYDDANGNKIFDTDEQVTDLEDYYANNPNKREKLLVGTTKTYSEATQYYIGKSALPKLRGAMNLSGGWKGFDLSVQMLYSLGGYSYDGAYAVLMGNDAIGGNNWHTDIRKRWQKPGDVTDVPRLSNEEDANVNSTSSRFVTRANYFGLNNIRLGYALPSSLLQRTKFIEQASLFVSGDNLWFHSARNGFNPSTAESGASDMYRYSPLSTITMGIRARF